MGLRSVLPAVAVALLSTALGACSSGASKAGGSGGGSEKQGTTDSTERASLASFESKEEIASFLKEHVKAQRRRGGVGGDAAAEASPPPASAPAPAAASDGKAAESVTNNQTAGVDEGGIVKVHGEHLVVLRRGRLFTVRIGDGALAPVSQVDAFAPGLDGRGAWYDEMLVHDNKVIVIGYSYARGGTEVGLFDIDRDGKLSHSSTYHLRSNDYFSSRNYASRLIGNKLVFYTPLYLNAGASDPFASFPAVRKWHDGATASEFVSLVEPAKVYRPIDPESVQALHSVTSCDLSKGELDCESTIVMGPAGRVFYVSQDAVYVWMTPWQNRGSDKSSPASLLYRMPLSGDEPGVVRVNGSPIDQFSFHQEDGQLHVLVRGEGRGDSMWNAEVKAGDLAALRLPISSFDGRAKTVSRDAYIDLPKPGTTSGLTNRFVGGKLLYGSGNGWGRIGQDAQENFVVTFDYNDRKPAKKVLLGHGVDRIEALGKEALVVGSDGADLVFSAVELDDSPGVAGRYVRRGASQGETRSHGFFYKPDSDRSGIFGLPIRSSISSGSDQLRQGSANIVFVRNDALDFKDLGELAASSEGRGDDACKASCVDWYGNARPVFIQGRTFALLGYELVEGKLESGRMVETRRVSFSPAPLAIR
ncbi:MAG: hypothetical protein HOV80_36550 [Polyangiaceae bacterium]|nr:hypothetical protein [Polyangiaceae bacterium]